MASSTIPFSQAEETLSSALLLGIVPSNEPWTPQLISDLYPAVRNSTPSTFPPPNFRTTTRYIPVTYVQSKDNPPFTWAQTVHAVLTQVQSDTGEQHGIWFDKMGSRQFPALQAFWGPLANLHYAVRPVAHVTPPFRNHDEQFRKKPVCGLSGSAYELLCDWLGHHQTCDSCQDSYHAGMRDMGFESMVVQPAQWAHPGAYFRAWPMVERALASYNCGLLTTANGLSAIVSSCIAMLGLIKLCEGLNEASPSASERRKGAGYRVLSHHTLRAIYNCVEASTMAEHFSVAFQDTIRMMADRMAVDATKMEPVGIEDRFSIARLTRGWTVGSMSRMEPIFARALWQRTGTEHPDFINFDLAKQDILSGWAGRAPCYAVGDKIAAVVLFANFVLVSQLVTAKGPEWLRCLVGILYDRDVGISKENPDVGVHLDAFENYVVIPASIGVEDGEREDRNAQGSLFGGYSGCIPISAFWNFLEQTGYDSATRENFWKVEQRLWRNSVEFDGDVFRSIIGPVYIDTQPLQPRLEECPKCSGNMFTRVGSIWRSIHGAMGKRRFWAVGERDPDQDASGAKIRINQTRGLIAAGEVRMDPRFGSRCRTCNSIAEGKVFRGWPLDRYQPWLGVLVADLTRRPPPSASRLSRLRPLDVDPAAKK